MHPFTHTSSLSRCLGSRVARTFPLLVQLAFVACAPEPPESFEFTATVAAIPLEDGAVLLWEFGTQGGSMIVIDFDLPIELFEADELIEIELVHEETGGPLISPFFLRQTLERRVNVAAGVASVQVQDQLSTFSLTGAVLTLAITIRAPGRVGTLLASVTLGDPVEAPVPVACEGFERDEPGGCRYYRFPGTATILSLEGGDLEVEFEANDSDGAQACSDADASFMGLVDGTTSSTTPLFGGTCCIEAAGLELGQSIDALALVEFEGTCTPVLVEFPNLLDLEACNTPCP